MGALIATLSAAHAQPAPQDAPASPMDWHEEPLPSPGSTTGVAAAGSRLGLTPKERAVIRDAIMGGEAASRHPECHNAEPIAFTIGAPYPRITRICPFPDDVRTQVPKTRRYRYLVAGDQIVFIDPADHHIVEVLK
jgi:hypothetical protein